MHPRAHQPTPDARAARTRARSGHVRARRTGVIAIVALASAAALAQAGGTSYSNSFDTEPLEGWLDHRVTISPSGEQFLGPFENEGTELVISNLAEHTHIALAIDLYVIGPWGDDAPLGLESLQRWSVRVDSGTPIIDSSFSNQGELGPAGAQTQSYPDPAGTFQREPRRGSFKTDSLGYSRMGQTDTIYRIIITAKHSGPVAHIRFSGSGLRVGAHRWGIDNAHMFTYTMALSEDPMADIMAPTFAGTSAAGYTVMPGEQPTTNFGPKGGGGGGGYPGGGGGGDPPGPPPPTLPHRDFNMPSIPAPGPALLVALGGTLVAMRHRRKPS